MKISAAAAALRDQSRDTDGQFGLQQHAESGIVEDVETLPVPPEGFTAWDGAPIEVNYSVWSRDVVHQWTRDTAGGEQVLTLMKDGGQLYTVNGKTHRTEGPAVAYPDGSCEYIQNGRHHRTDGPAVINHDGSEEFWLEGNLVAASELPTYSRKSRRRLFSRWK